MSGSGNVGVVDAADGAHGAVVVVLRAEDEGEDWGEDDGTEEGGDVAGEHWVAGAGVLLVGCLEGENVKVDSLCACRGDGQDAVLFLGCHEPRDKGDGEAEGWRGGCCNPVLVLPDEGHGAGEDCRGDDHAHQQVEITHSNTSVVKTGGEAGHGDGPEHTGHVRDPDETLALGGWVDVGLVDIVGEDG